MRRRWAIVFLVCFAGGALADGSKTITATPMPDGKSTQLAVGAGTSLVVLLLEVKAGACHELPGLDQRSEP